MAVETSIESTKSTGVGMTAIAERALPNAEESSATGVRVNRADRDVEWRLNRVSYRYPGTHIDTLSAVSLDIESARLTAVIGPNGAGKSTLMQLLLGTLVPSSGVASFRNCDVQQWKRRQLAKEIAVVPQGEVEPLYTVRDAVAMGRYPHLGPWKREGREDVAAIVRAMERCDIQAFSGRWITTLSGGERQRVRVARALAQETRVIVLDEPTASLDIRHEMAMFEQMHHERMNGSTVVVVTHNLNLAARYADTLILLHDGHVVARGTPLEVLTKKSVETVYEWPVDIEFTGDGIPLVIPQTSLVGSASQ